MAEDRRRVALIITGGTIDSVGTDRLDLGWYLEAGKRLGDGELVARVPELDQLAEVTEVPFRRLPSQSITTADWLDMIKTIQDLVAGGADGVVITHGTNTLEETAYFLHLTLKTDRPVVLVGAMRPSSGVSADGDLNLINAVRVAAEPASRGAGVLVVLNDTIHSARDVTKTATYPGRDLPGPRPRAARLRRRRRPRALLPSARQAPHHRDGLPAGRDHRAAQGRRGGLLHRRGRDHGRRGRGRRGARAGVIVCQGTRVGSGRTLRSPGLRRKGWVASDNLQPWKARLLLALALNRTSDPDEIQSYFDRY